MTEEQSKVFQRVVSVAQTFLAEAMEKGAVTPTLIAEKVDFVATHMAPGENVDRKEVVAELIRRFSLWIGGASTLSDKTGHKDWLTAARRKDWRYWQRYRDFLERKMSVKAVDALDDATNKVLELLEDPLREGCWDRRGLVVGHVQSGKTGNYTGLICKAADAGYKIVIVLAGLHNNLRSQTQIRLEEGFLGYETSAKNDVVRYIGVGENGRDAEIRPNCATNRSDNGDFNTKVAKHLAISPEQRPWLFVVKKNKTVLDRLLKWIRNHVADSKDADGRPLVSGFPLLLIDDEADHASVDTGDQVVNKDGTVDDEYQPKAINSRIRKILHSFSRKAYVGYTATPFANIFIDRRKATKEEGPDLFPQSFIINISAPSNYVGPARVFGLRSTEGRDGGLPLTREVNDQTDARGEDGWMPPRHDKSHVPMFEGRDEVPPSLREAVSVFVLACAVRVLRGEGRRHCSMLIHVTRYTAVQEEVRRQVDELVKRFRNRVRGFGQAEKDKLMAEWRELWESDFVPTSAAVATAMGEAGAEFDLPQWEDVEAVLPEVLEDLANSVRAINGSAGDVLDYAEREETGLKVIAVGGDKLARGLTLEGLCVSYFVRSTKMYDTLMQMGRWFGYRPGYLDLCRLYTTSDLVEWFGHIADAAEELRQEFDTMAAVKATPESYGMKVQSHPVLMVTSPIKMRSAKSLQLSFSGEVLETVAFHRDRATLDKNLTVAERLLEAAGAPCCDGVISRRRGEGRQEWKGFLWGSVPADYVVDFFTSYLTHPAARKVNSAVLADFVKVMAAGGELTSWTVVLLGGGDGASHVFCGKYAIENMVVRKPKEGGEHYSIGRLLSPRDESIDLEEDAWQAALELTVSAWTKDPARGTEDTGKEPPKSPSGPCIRRVRGLGADGVPGNPKRGLLLIYPLDPAAANLPAGGPPVIAFGASFPASRSTTTVKYEVDHLLWETEYAPAD